MASDMLYIKAKPTVVSLGLPNGRPHLRRYVSEN